MNWCGRHDQVVVHSDTVYEPTAAYKVGLVCFESRQTTAMCNVRMCDRLFVSNVREQSQRKPWEEIYAHRPVTKWQRAYPA